jgi:hypothetical protein
MLETATQSSYCHRGRLYRQIAGSGSGNHSCGELVGFGWIGILVECPNNALSMDSLSVLSFF